MVLIWTGVSGAHSSSLAARRFGLPLRSHLPTFCDTMDRTSPLLWIGVQVDKTSILRWIAGASVYAPALVGAIEFGFGSEANQMSVCFFSGQSGGTTLFVFSNGVWRSFSPPPPHSHPILLAAV